MPSTENGKISVGTVDKVRPWLVLFGSLLFALGGLVMMLQSHVSLGGHEGMDTRMRSVEAFNASQVEKWEAVGKVLERLERHADSKEDHK